MERRTFLKAAGAAAGSGARLSKAAPVQTAGPAIALVVDPADPVATAAPCKWAVQELQTRLQLRHIENRVIPSIRQALPGEICCVVSGPVLAPTAVMPDLPPPPNRSRFRMPQSAVARY